MQFCDDCGSMMVSRDGEMVCQNDDCGATTERDEALAERCASILKAAVPESVYSDPGERLEDHVHVHRLDAGPSAIHIHSTMRMGFVADEACEAYDVDRLFIADHSVLPNGLGGPNPTNTGQALAMRTGDRIADRYFGG